jgi:PKD domain
LKGKLRSIWAVAAAFLLLGGAVGAAVALTGSSRKGEREPAWLHGREAPNALREAKFERKQGGEANRGAPKNPASEQVGDRAWPRSYVDDQLALKGRQAFDRLPGGASASRVPRSALAAAPVTGPWSELGPSTPNVPGPASQFFDPRTLTGPTTQESGRVTALAIDPGCAATNCKMWVAAAGGGIWRTNDALASPVQWIPADSGLPTNAFGSLYYDATHNTLYAGSGEPNGSGDSEAGLGLFKSTDSGASWTLVPGSAAVATNRSIGAIAVDPNNANTIYIGTDVARHGSSSVNGGRRTPPNAPALGVYKSTDGGTTFTLLNMAATIKPNPNPSSSGADWFQGGINKLEFDPNVNGSGHHDLYAGVIGYGVWRSDQSSVSPTWEQVFHTMNQNDFSDPNNPIGDTFGDRTEFDLVDLGGGHTRAYVGDSSDDWATDGDPSTPAPEAWRVDNINSTSASTLVDDTGTTPETLNPGWTELSSQTNGDSGFGVYNWCQNGQCGYDSFVAHPPGASAGTVWFGGSMNYDELPAYDQFGTGAPQRSNGRAVVRSTNAGAGNQVNADTTVSWQDMTAVLSSNSGDANGWGVANNNGIHPDLHAIAFANSGNTAFIGSDGGVVRIDVHTTKDQSASCAKRTWDYSPDPTATPTSLASADLTDCQQWLSAVPNSITPLNGGLRDLQFQSLSYNPKNQTGDLLGGTQDNGTWSLAPPSTTALETVGGDGGQSGFNFSNPTIRFHNYFDATPEVNFHGTNPATWLDIYDPLQITGENRSFYVPFISDPMVAGRLFIGLQHVWRTDDNGGNEQDLISDGCYAYNLNPFRTNPCGDWQRLGVDLTGDSFGSDRDGQYIVATERAPSNTSTLWAATRTGRVFVSTNADALPADVQFTRIDEPTTPGRFVSGIAIDPGNPDHAWISYSGYNAYTPTTPGHVFDVLYNPSTHSATFTDISHNIGDQPVTGIAEDRVSGAVFAATDFGVMELAAGSSTWTRAGSALPFASVFALRVADGARVLYAATHGRGAWMLALPPAPPNPPTGAIHGPSVLELGRKATFTATGTAPNGHKVTFQWTLPGKPSSATGSTVTFTPTKLGKHTITLKITDTTTHASATVTQAVTVRDTTKPTAHLVAPHRARVGQRLTFRGSAHDASGIRSARLSFGDGSSVTLHLGRGGAFKVHHTYHRAGTFRVRLKVTDRTGHTRTVTVHLKVRKRKR